MADIETAERLAPETEVPSAATTGDGGGAGDDGPGGGGGDGGSPSGGGRPTHAGSRLAYNPALDGIRGVAVAAVLLFHGGYAWAQGGFLGVSTFFTLSGFLITSLVLAERRDTGGIRLTAFWARRLRRLFPASALALLGISLSAVVLDQGWERDLQGDVLAALFQVANWRFLLADRSYAELFATPSPVLHFWSLAIEEQFYWVFPLLAAGVFGLAKGSVKVFGGVLAGLLALSAVLTVAYGPDESSVVYYATPIRMGEILVGCLLAVVIARGLPGGAVVARLAAVAGVVALAASAFCWWNLSQDSQRLYQGGFLAYALLSAALVLSATVPGPMRTVLGVPPLRMLGMISYGVYLYHWPIFLVLDPERTGYSGERLFVIRIAATLVVAIASYFLLERPIRRGWTPRLPGGLPMPALAAGTFALVAIVAVVVPRVSEPPPDPFAGAEQLNDFSNDPDPSTIPAGALFGLTIGDSTLFRTAWGLGTWGDDTDLFNIVGGAGGLGCGITRGGEIRYRGAVSETQSHCDSWEEALVESIDVRRERYGHVDFAFVQYGPWDVADRKLEGSDEWVAPGDEVYDDYLRSEVATMVDLLLDQGVYVVWAAAPHLDVGLNDEARPQEPYAESEPARIDRFNEVVREVVNARDGAVMMELGEFVAERPGGEFGATYTNDDGEVVPLRPDGVHFDDAGAIELAREGMGELFLEALWAEPVPPGSDWDRAPIEPVATTTTTVAD